MHGFIDSVFVPLHLGSSGVIEPNHISTSTSTSTFNPSAKSKGKAKANHTPQGGTGGTFIPERTKYDVVGSWTSAEAQDMRNKVELAATLGYSTICLVISIPTTTDPSLLSFPTPLYPDLDPRTAKNSSSSMTPATVQGQILQLWRIHIRDYGDDQVKSVCHRGQFGLSQSTSSLFPASTTFISIQPTTLTSFSHVSLSLSASSPFAPSLITLDPSLQPRLPFPFKRGLVHTLQRSGLKIEIVYRGITCADECSGLSQATMRRRNWISGAREIVRVMGGEGVVLSSWARQVGEMRGVKDMINLCSLIGLDPASAKETISAHPQRVILKGLAMRQTYKGVFSNPSLITTTTTTPTATSTCPTKSTTTTATAKNEKKRSAPSETSESIPPTSPPSTTTTTTTTTTIGPTPVNSCSKPTLGRPSNNNDNGFEFVGVEVEVQEGKIPSGGAAKRSRIK
ncbi:BQ2448_7498 [Microbotryum intermedium]|uniref:BQ2448_7498 protein n=1 Tax=Microbotryum intermedium TaxID=269621 RepID=A0A238FIF4_9BASI|nr:BQ2448_7498 [Microbotryum intermedium]